MAHHGSGLDNEQSAQVSVSLLRDTAKLGLASSRLLPGGQAQPCCELPAGAELVWIGDGGGDGCRRANAKAGYRHEPATCFTLGMPGHELLIETRISLLIAIVLRISISNADRA